MEQALPIRVRLLGPVEVEVQGRPVALGGERGRALLALLALAGELGVTRERLIDGLWGERPPARAGHSLAQAILRLRRGLDEAGLPGNRIITRADGYELLVEPGERDIDHWAAALQRGRAARLGEDPTAALAALDEALALWRGRALEGVGDGDVLRAERARLEEAKLTATVDRLELQIELGEHEAVVGPIEALIAQHPYAERLRRLHMLALYRSGRQADALSVFHAARARLREDLGIEPGAGLRLLQEAVLRQDPALGGAEDAAQPLGEAAVLGIAAHYAGPEAAGRLPLARCMEATGGVSSRVHRFVGEWARAELAERLVGAAARTRAERTVLRAAEAELAGKVADQQAIVERDVAAVTLAGGGRRMPVCPYRGLAPFEAAHAAYFAGRERLVAAVVARLAGAPLVGLIGPSGSGKSSLLRAGLLPALATGALPGSERWTRLLLRPGPRPLEALERALDATRATSPAELAGRARAVVAVDQFEEVFTACPSEGDRTRFVDALVDAAQSNDARLTVVLAIRADFYGRCAAHPGLAELLARDQVLVGPMRPDELRRTIERPAERVGLTIEAGVVEALVAGVTDEPGGLPLLSTTLRELWELGEGLGLRLADLERGGGVQGAVARLAERAFARLDEREQAAARRILLRLADPTDGPPVRRRASLSELQVDRDDDARRVLDVLTASRLVTVSEGAAEVAHEALMREWPRLRDWLAEDAEGRRLHRAVGDAARGWEDRGGHEADLLRGPRLTASLDWAAAHEEELNELERGFLAESIAAAERAAERERSSNRRLRALLAGVGGLLLLALAAGGIAVQQRRNAEANATAADAERLGTQALVEDRVDRSLLLARAGVAIEPSVRTRGNLLASLLRSPAVIGVLPGDGDRQLDVRTIDGGRTIALTDNDGTLLLFDARTRRRVGRLQAAGRMDELAASPGGRRIAIAGEGVQILDRRTLRVIARLSPVDGLVLSLAFSPDGRTLLGAHAGPEGAGVLQRWNARTGEPVPLPPRSRRDPPLAEWVAYLPGGRRIVTSTRTPPETVVRDAGTLAALRAARVGSDLSALSPDGRTVAIGQENGEVVFMDVGTGARRRTIGRHAAQVTSIAYAPDGRELVTGGDDNNAIVWDATTGEAHETLTGHAGRITGLTVTPDGRTLVTASLDGTAMLWDLAGDRRLGTPFTAGSRNEEVPYFDLSPDGRTLARPEANGRVRLIDTRSLRTTGRITAIDGSPVLRVRFSPDGAVLATSGAGSVALWRTSDASALGAPLRGHHGPVPAIDFDPRGRRLASGGLDGTVRTWDTVQRRPAREPIRLSAPVTDVAFSPDGTMLAGALANGMTVVVDPRSGRRRARLRADDLAALSVRFSPDGRLLATTGSAGIVRLWNTATWRRTGRELAEQAGFGLSATFSPHGRLLGTGSTDGTVLLWDLASGRPVGTPLPGIPNTWAAGEFTPDGRRLFVVTDDGAAFRWEIGPRAWETHACTVANRELTRREWADVVPGRDWRTVCR